MIVAMIDALTTALDSFCLALATPQGAVLGTAWFVGVAALEPTYGVVSLSVLGIALLLVPHLMRYVEV